MGVASLGLARAGQEHERTKRHCHASAQAQITIPCHGVLLIGNAAAGHASKTAHGRAWRVHGQHGKRKIA
jgi:hypothetical protein